MAIDAEDPGNADDEMMVYPFADFVFAESLSQAVVAGCAARGVNFKRLLALSIEDVVGGKVHHPGTDGLAGLGNIFRAGDIDRIAEVAVVFGAVDGGEGGTMDNGVRRIGPDIGIDGFGLGQVEILDIDAAALDAEGLEAPDDIKAELAIIACD